MKQLIEPIRWGAPSCWTRFLIAGIGIMLTVAGGAQSVPPLVNYQGRLANPDGTPFPTADYELSFRIWNTNQNGVLVWGPQVFDGASGLGHGAKIPVVQGYFNVILGPTDTNGMSLADAFTNTTCFVEVTVSNRSPILPRQQILSAPYAIKAGSLIRDLQEALCPPGTIVAFGGANVPSGWILCDGRPLRSADCPRLYAAIGTAWGTAADDADGSTDFRAPDLRGLFLRGVDNSPVMGESGRDPDRGDARRGPIQQGANFGNRVGSYQHNEIEGHTHGSGALRAAITTSSGGLHYRPSPPGFFGTAAVGVVGTGGSGPMPNSTEIFGRSGNLDTHAPQTDLEETRPKNAYVNYIIKY